MERESSYNYAFVSLQGERLLCNGLSGTVIAFPTRPLVQYREDDKKLLHRHHFLVESPDAERELLQARNSAARDSGTHDLTIMLHEDCNFRCTYCFEEFRPRAIGDAELRAIEQHVRTVVKAGEQLRIHFYGGEPLLAWDELCGSVRSLQTLSSEQGAHFSFYVTTNGFLLDETKAAFLATNGAAHVKVTLDGDASSHDLRRVRKGGQPTFARIYENARAASHRLPVVVRVNLDSATASTCPNLLEAIARDFRLDRTRIDFNLQYEQSTRRLVGGVSYAELASLQELALGLGIRLRVPPLARPSFCKFQNRNALLIDTDGQTFRCEKSNELAEQPLAGDAREPLRRLPILSARTRFLSTQDQCTSCRLLPICGGGCTVLSLGTERPSCPPWKESVERYLAIQHAATAAEAQ